MYFLRRFLRARQHDLKKARDMYAATVKWRAENGVDTILDDFHFHERDAFISLYPQGYHKTDKTVSSPISRQCVLCMRSKSTHRRATHESVPDGADLYTSAVRLSQ